MLAITIEIFRYRELLLSLVIKELKVRYKQALLGMAWAVFTPLAMMLIFTFVFSKVTKISTGQIPYPVFAYCGLLPWTFFAGSLASATNSLVANTNLITKIYFPREVFPLAVILARFIDFCVASLILVGLMLFYHIPFQITILLFPLILLIQVILMIGLSLLLSVGNLFFRDVKYIIDVVLILWMFVTSVIYPINVDSPALQRVLMLNPMTPILNAYRALILKGEFPQIGPLLPAIAISVVIFFIGIVLFHKTEHLFAENI